MFLGTKITEDLLKLMTNDKDADITIYAFRAHRAILTSRSEYLKSMIEEAQKKSKYY